MDGEGRLRYGNRALLALLDTDRDRLGTLTLQSLELDGEDRRNRAQHRAHGGRAPCARTRAGGDRTGSRSKSKSRSPPVDEGTGFRVLTARDMSATRRAAERNERDHVRVSRLLELAQRSNALTETEILDRTLQLAQELTHSAQGYLFLPVGDATHARDSPHAAAPSPANR